ncbi:hypothetical protein K466DRAFT_595796 [Polyporus arcularius HHB13444]|uniref:F-box domain-containing protein n=1 Tax=Polyporus arcularius HHB13444 TaxID=1314778 RepID=A0A5C3PPX0_9APHY|nr:hypothetical protein K466DRAFT_595796 [Polyporus arcularius HHB13444]
MDTLPVELITRISFLACTDGGLTACSLSRVCRFVRAAACPARYYSVSFDGASLLPLRSFLSVYQAEQAGKPRVHHLFISTFPLRGGELTPILHSPEEYTSEVGTLLRTVSAALETLTCIGFRRSIPDLVALGTVFPVLEELTICDMPNPHRLDLHVPDVSRPLFPALRMLHKWNRSIEPWWSAHAPGLTHIRISELLPHDFALGPLPDGSAYHCLKQLILQPRIRDLNVPFRAASFFWNSSSATDRVPLCILPLEQGAHRSTAQFKRCHRTSRRQWVARLEGQPGCWGLPVLDVNAKIPNVLEIVGWKDIVPY